jgi:hypothetical protein
LPTATPAGGNRRSGAFQSIIKLFPALRAYLSLDNIMFFKENQMSSEHRIKSDPLATEGWKRAGWTSEEKYKAYHNQYYQKRKSEISKERRSNIPQRWIDRTKRRAKEKGLEWNLSKSFLRTLIVPICPILVLYEFSSC